VEFGAALPFIAIFLEVFDSLTFPIEKDFTILFHFKKRAGNLD
jgi:hypothetical protein